MEEIITATAYLELFLRSIDQPGLVRTFLRLILAHRYENRRIIDTLVQRIAATSKVVWAPTGRHGARGGSCHGEGTG